MIPWNKKAYTLAEFVLIVVLVLILGGVLGAAYSRRVATHQAREAEDFMRAVRYEQEDRCAMGKKYEVFSKRLKTFLKKKKGTKHWVYDLSSSKGMVARSKVYNYTLKMPSYADGRICCDTCEKLDRHYSPCALLTQRADFVSAEPECVSWKEAAESTSPEEQPLTPAPETEPEDKADTPADTPRIQPETIPSSDPLALVNGQPVPPESTQEKHPADDEQAADELEWTAREQAAPACAAPEQGTFYITSCDTYQPGLQGAVFFTWNPQTCQYDASQNCLVPARWKKSKVMTRVEKGVYPSDVDKLCGQLLEQLGCSAQAGPDQECFEVDSTCYSQCEITSQTRLQESSTIVLYDVTLALYSLQCQASKSVTVEIP